MGCRWLLASHDSMAEPGMFAAGDQERVWLASVVLVKVNVDTVQEAS